MATGTPTTRRTVLASMTGAALTAIAPSPAAAASFTAEPTMLGRRFLRYTALIRWTWRHPIGEDDLATHERLDRYHAELDRTRAEIVARPVISVADLVDRLILATHECEPWRDVQPARVLPVLAGALAAAGITPGECCRFEWQEADALAA